MLTKELLAQETTETYGTTEVDNKPITAITEIATT